MSDDITRSAALLISIVLTLAGCGTQSQPQAGRGSDGGSSNDASSNDASGGGAEGGTSLDCAFATGDNCWKATIGAALGCLPPSSQMGTFSADTTTCTYASGQVVTFDMPLAIQGKWIQKSFTLASAGSRCLRWDQLANGFTITTAAGAVMLTEDTGLMIFTLVCPNGTTYSGPLGGLSACKEAAPGAGSGCGCSHPNDAGTYAGTFGSFSLDLSGTSDPQGTEIFYCNTP